MDIAETVKAAEFFQADGVILTGSSTGCSADASELAAVKAAAPDIPVLIGSGIKPENVTEFKSADGFIVGSYLKENGFWKNELNEDRIAAICNSVA